MSSALRVSSATASGLGSPSPLKQRHRVSPVGVRVAAVGRSAAGEAATQAADSSSLVPRRCTLEELTFSDDGRLLSRAEVSAPGATAPTASGSRSSHIVDLFWAAVEASAQVKDLETITGRLSMVAFFVAISVEVLTGSGIFSSLDQQGLQGSLGLGLVTALGGGAFAVALRGKRSVTDALSANCQGLVDSTVDSLIDSLFYQEQFLPHQSSSNPDRD